MTTDNPWEVVRRRASEAPPPVQPDFSAHAGRPTLPIPATWAQAMCDSLGSRAQLPGSGGWVMTYAQDVGTDQVPTGDVIELYVVPLAPEGPEVTLVRGLEAILVASGAGLEALDTLRGLDAPWAGPAVTFDGPDGKPVSGLVVPDDPVAWIFLGFPDADPTDVHEALAHVELLRGGAP